MTLKPSWLVGVGLIVSAMLWQSRLGLVVCSGESMRPTFASGALLLVDRGAYDRAEPRRGDIVVARSGGEWILKRVVGLPGETVEVRAGRLFVNGMPWREPQAVLPGSLSIRPGRLQPDRYALLGDNRSLDDFVPVHAVVARDQLVGRVRRLLPGANP